MQLENYLIGLFLLRVKKLYLYMYMYLSDRIRRMFLSGACPQNLSPKKPLSLKDQRFLQKTNADKNLTRTLVKEQKLLYEKHIGLLLQGSVLKAATAYSNSKQKGQQEKEEKEKNNSNTPIYWQVCSKTQKTIKTQKNEDRNHRDYRIVRDHRPDDDGDGHGPLRAKEWALAKAKAMAKAKERAKERTKSEPTVRLVARGTITKGSEDRPLGVIDLKVKNTDGQENIVPKGGKLFPGFVVFEGKKNYSAKTNQSISQKTLSRKKESFSDNIWKACSNYNFPRKSSTLFVQSFKVQKKKMSDLKKQYNKNEKKESLANVSGFNEKGKMSLSISKESIDSYASLFHAMTLRDPKHHDATQALLSPGKSQYTNCRYLYDHESLKTCIVPQLFKNQKPISRAKTLLHERKKIALLYGQLAKKDILNISRKAMSIPGFFEDNMFTLLESRVDVCVFRAGFSKTIAGARQLIRNGFVLVNGKKISSCKRRAKPGDYFTFTFKQAFYNPYRYTTLELYHLCLSSNFHREWVSMNKMKFFRELAFKQGFETKKKEGQKNNTSKTWPLLFGFFAVRFRLHYKPAFCSSLYWSFFLYKLYKIPSFSCFFETKRKYNIFLYTLKKKRKITSEYLSKGTLSLDSSDPALETLQGFPFETKIPKASCKQAVHGLIRRTNGMHAQSNHHAFGSFSFFFGQKKNIVLLNLYTQLLLKKLKNLKTKQNEKQKKPFSLFRKNIAYSNLWAIWGQKPLHLEISHKTGAFIYMYKPQKIISPVCLDFKP